MSSKKKDNRSDLKLGWHFLPADRKLEYGDGRKAEPGKTLSYTGPSYPKCCYQGMHASSKIIEAARFGKGPVLCRVEVWGDVHTETNKFAGRHRKVLWMGTLTKEDFKSLFKSVGYDSTSGIISDLVDDLMHACGNSLYKDKIEKWLQDWAKKNGCVDGAYVTKTKFVYTKPHVDAKVLKSLLNDRFVKSESDLKADLGDAFDLTMWDDAIFDLGNEFGVAEVTDYVKRKTFGYETGFVLQRKQKSGGKRKK